MLKKIKVLSLCFLLTTSFVVADYDYEVYDSELDLLSKINKSSESKIIDYNEKGDVLGSYRDGGITRYFVFTEEHGYTYIPWCRNEIQWYKLYRKRAWGLAFHATGVWCFAWDREKGVRQISKDSCILI